MAKKSSIGKASQLTTKSGFVMGERYLKRIKTSRLSVMRKAECEKANKKDDLEFGTNG